MQERVPALNPRVRVEDTRAKPRRRRVEVHPRLSIHLTQALPHLHHPRLFPLLNLHFICTTLNTAELCSFSPIRPLSPHLVAPHDDSRLGVCIFRLPSGCKLRRASSAFHLLTPPSPPRLAHFQQQRSPNDIIKLRRRTTPPPLKPSDKRVAKTDHAIVMTVYTSDGIVAHRM